jgi:hypothetical protein
VDWATVLQNSWNFGYRYGYDVDDSVNVIELVLELATGICGKLENNFQPLGVPNPQCQASIVSIPSLLLSILEPGGMKHALSQLAGLSQSLAALDWSFQSREDGSTATSRWNPFGAPFWDADRECIIDYSQSIRCDGYDCAYWVGLGAGNSTIGSDYDYRKDGLWTMLSQPCLGSLAESSFREIPQAVLDFLYQPLDKGCPEYGRHNVLVKRSTVWRNMDNAYEGSLFAPPQSCRSFRATLTVPLNWPTYTNYWTYDNTFPVEFASDCNKVYQTLLAQPVNGTASAGAPDATAAESASSMFDKCEQVRVRGV